MPKRSIANGVVYLTEPVEAWNIDGSSDAQAESGSWIKDAEEATGRRRGRCSFAGCPNLAQVGGHVWIRQMGCFIAPICKPCNSCDNQSRYQGAGARLRQNIEVMETEVTEGMRHVERRVTGAPQKYKRMQGTCTRCGRKGHSIKECFAKRDVHGDVLTEEDGESSSEDDVCFRCGRVGHWSSDCYAKKDADGNWLCI